ncbi:chemotaxis protein CheW [Desulfovibrio sp. OttesenSCG-928-O18]|nr:chemotaxis protein CheW [Desulfovibrio sp. OttesenSCG-928-O18]
MSIEQNETVTMGTFLLEDQEFGVDILRQREVLRMMPVTKVPRCANFLEGVINLRGAIIPIVNLRKRFGMPYKEFSKDTRILNIEVTDSLVVGFIVDAVGKVRRMERGKIEPTPPVVASVDSDYIMGVGRFDDALLLILDVPKILSADDIENLEQVS